LQPQKKKKFVQPVELYNMYMFIIFYLQMFLESVEEHDVLTT